MTAFPGGAVQRGVDVIAHVSGVAEVARDFQSEVLIFFPIKSVGEVVGLIIRQRECGTARAQKFQSATAAHAVTIQSAKAAVLTFCAPSAEKLGGA